MTTLFGRVVYGVFATLIEFERDLIRDRIMARLAAARARKGDRSFGLTKAQVSFAQVANMQQDAPLSVLCAGFGIKRVTPYRYVTSTGELRDYERRVLGLA